MDWVIDIRISKLTPESKYPVKVQESSRKYFVSGSNHRPPPAALPPCHTGALSCFLLENNKKKLCIYDWKGALFSFLLIKH